MSDFQMGSQTPLKDNYNTSFATLNHAEQLISSHFNRCHGTSILFWPPENVSVNENLHIHEQNCDVIT